jgi:exodeoxyribonuclease VII large subunit
MVAHEFVKTPTALADFIVGIYETEDERLSSLQTRMRLAFSNKIYAAESALDSLQARVKGGFALKIATMEAALNVLEAGFKAADPRRVLERGYALAVDADGVVVKGAAGRSVGDKVSLMFSDGTLDCTVNLVKMN